MSNAETINSKIDLVYSQDDRGYYFQNYGGKTDKVSKLFKTRDAALKALNSGEIKWHKI